MEKHSANTTAPTILNSSQNLPRKLLQNEITNPPSKRRASTPDPSRRPLKYTRTDENALADIPNHFFSLDTLGTAISQVEHPLAHTSRQLDHIAGSPTRTPNTADNDLDSNDDETLIGDHKCEAIISDLKEVADTRHEAQSSRSKAEKPVFDQQRQPLTHLDVVQWVNALKRFKDLHKTDWRQDEEFYKLLQSIDAEKDNPYLTLQNLKKTQLAVTMMALSKSEGFEEKSTKLARRMYKFWRLMFREA